MLKLDVKDISGKKVGSIELDGAIFSEEMNEHLLWEVVKWQRAKARAGTAKVKTRGEVHGSAKKPYKQKGTGAARRGDVKSPIMVGGGQTHGPAPRDYEYELPKKARKKALRSVLSLRAKQDRIIVLDKFPVAGGKAKAVSSALKALGAAKKALIVDATTNADLIQGTRNLASSKWLAPAGLNVYDVLHADTLILTRDVVATIQDALRPSARS
jgi:large subunit ribosomal protein L4